MLDLTDKKITVMGLGHHGGAVGNIRWLVSQGAVLTVTDMKPADSEDLAGALDELKDLEDINWVLGEHREEDFVAADMVLRNPAVTRTSKFLEIARENGAVVEMDSSLFFKMSLTQDIIGVTGSKGKTTTAHWIARMLDARLIGVEGMPVLPILDEIDTKSTVVFELSSWRLEALDEHKLSPRTAVMTSLYRDHLNTYDSLEDYAETKKAIFRHQDAGGLVLLNGDDELVKSWENEVKGEVILYSAASSSTLGVFPEAVRGIPQHVWRNMQPGIILAQRRGVSDEEIAKKISEPLEIPHRLEKIRVLDGVEYINDSSATIPDAAIAAMQAYADKPVILIAGGSDKGLEFAEWDEAVKKSSVRKIIWLPGSVTAQMKRILSETHDTSGVSWVEAVSMQEAVEKASEVAESGDVVLMSPGATSFGLFKHEFDRGDQFREAVMSL